MPGKHIVQIGSPQVRIGDAGKREARVSRADGSNPGRLCYRIDLVRDIGLNMNAPCDPDSTRGQTKIPGKEWPSELDKLWILKPGVVKLTRIEKMHVRIDDL